MYGVGEKNCKSRIRTALWALNPYPHSYQLIVFPSTSHHQRQHRHQCHLQLVGRMKTKSKKYTTYYICMYSNMNYNNKGKCKSLIIISSILSQST